MAKTEKFKRFQKHLENGNVEGVRETLESKFVEEIIDPYWRMRPVHLACKSGNFEIVKLLLEKKCDIESENKKKMRPIHLACQNGHLEIVKLLIDNKCNIESENIWGRRTIHFACEKGHFQIVNLLIEKQCNIESENFWRIRAIHFACQNGHLEIVKLLIDNNCNIESENFWGRRTIHYACEKGYFEIVKLLIEKKCNIENEADEKIRGIHYACQNGHFEIVKLLIGNKCNIESETDEGKRTIHYACENGHFKIVKLLIEKQCNIESENVSGLRPIHYACEKGFLQIVNLLIERKCIIESETEKGVRAIHYACQNGYLNIVKLLMKKKCNIESENVWRMRAIHYACQNGHFEIVKLLIDKKCNIESETDEGLRPIHYACEKGYLQIVNLLIEKQCNIESENFWKMRPIHLACENGHFDIVKLLIEKQCNIESETKEGRRPIHLACENSHKEIAKLLIVEKCFINVCDRDGRTPFALAKLKGHGEIVKLLSEFIIKKINDSILKNDDGNFAKFYNSELLTGQNWLEMAYEKKADKILKYFLNRPIDITEIGYIKTVIESHSSESINSELWQECLLYKTIKDRHEKGFQSICRPNIINRPIKIIPCSFLEFTVKNENFIFFQEIMKKTLYDSEIWKRAKETALYKGRHHIHSSISNREYLLKCRQKNNVSILHTAVCDNDPEMLEYILREGLVDPNHNHEVLGTAFAFAISLCHRRCLTIFERFNIDCNTQNRYLQSPLHEAINNGMIEHCQYLMDHVENIDQPGFNEQTALHCAVIQGCEELCDFLTEKGADCLRYMEFCSPLTEKKDSPKSKYTLQLSQRENPLTLCLKMNQTIYPCFLNSLDREKANSSDDEENSLLHLSAKLMKPDLCKVILQAGADIDSLNKKGNTPLFELLSYLNQQLFITNEDKIIETVNLFVQAGCDLNKSLKGDLSLVQIITKFNSERLLLALLPWQQNQAFEIDENVLKISLERHFFGFCEALLKLFPKDVLASSITINVIEEAVKDNCTTLLKSLVINASDDVQQIVLEFSLYHLLSIDDKDSFQCLLDLSINNPVCFENGETLLTRLLKESKFDFCRQIIESKTNNKRYINLKNKRNQTPLQVAIEIESIDIILSLLYKTENIDNEDSEGHTALTQLFEKMSNKNEYNENLKILNAIKAIIFKGGNIYHETSKGGKAIDYCPLTTTREEIEKVYDEYMKSTNPVLEKIIEKERIITLEKKICPICLDGEVDSAFECGHTICQICSDDIKKCPFCGLEPVRPKRIYFN